MDALDKITALTRRRPAAERVANQMRELIRSGSLKAGDKLPSENELAAALQVSRPVVREALRGLQLLGIVETRQGGRCFVTDLTMTRLLGPLQFVIGLDESNVDKLYEARVVVECGIIRLGAGEVADGTLGRLEQMVEAGYALASDPVGFRVLDLEFHEALMRLSANPFLEVTARSLYELGMEFRRVASETPGVIERSAAEHETIVRALATRDPDRAADAMRAHLTSIHRTTVEAMGQLRAASATRAHSIAAG